jgi:predicted aconitase with swiveling domain
MPHSSDYSLLVETLIPGRASGVALKLAEPLNVWGGLDPRTGRIDHPSHPQFGVSIAGKVLVLPHTRGSGTNAQVIAEAVGHGKGPCGVVLATADFVLCAGLIVGAELYGARCPVVTAAARDYARIRDGARVAITANEGATGLVTIN